VKYYFAIVQFLLLGTTISTVFWMQPSAQAAETDQSNLATAESVALPDNVAIESDANSGANKSADSQLELGASPTVNYSIPMTSNFTLEAQSTATVLPAPGTVSTSAADLMPQSTPAAETPTPQTKPLLAQTTITPVVSNPRISLRGRNYVGVGANIGVAGDTAIGDTSFAAFSKFALTNEISVRPAIFASRGATFLVPFTYDFPVISTGAVNLNPYVGVGFSISTRNETADFLVTGGIDFPINDRLTATAAANFGPVGGLDIGVMLGLAYTFGR